MKKWLWGFIIANAGVLFNLFLSVLVASAIVGAVVADSESEDASSGNGCSVTGKLDETTLKDYLSNKGVFKDQASTFLYNGKKYKVEPMLVIAIAMHETGNGTSQMVVQQNNPGGLMGDGDGFSFSTLEKGIEAMIKNLAVNYIEMGLTTPELIQPKYAPIGAGNDGTGLNKAWLDGVNAFIKELGGVVNCDNGGSNSGNGAGTGKYIIPVDNPIISSGFVDRINPITQVPEHHKGLDFAQPMGSAIKAADDGVVVFSGMGDYGNGFGGYGNAILIEHKKNKEWTLYGHQSQVIAKVGQKVKQGQVIGKVGSTGQSSGPHLHLEIRKQQFGGQIDPAPVLGIKP